MKRHDPHCERHLVPADYEFEASVYLGSEKLDADPADYGYGDLVRENLAEAFGDLSFACYVYDSLCQRDDLVPGGNFERKRTCDVCGAGFNYGVALRHASGHLVVVGWQCGLKLFAEQLSAKQYQDKRMRKAAAQARRRARALVAARKYLAENGLEYMEQAKHYILRDMFARMVQYDNPRLTEKQQAFARKLIKEERNPAPQQPTAPKCDAPEGKGLAVKGEILSIKLRANAYGERVVMTVQDERGFRCWGTAPSSFENRPDDPAVSCRLEKGDNVEFVANLERSDDDPTFAFFKRPRKCVRLNAMQTQE